MSYEDTKAQIAQQKEQIAQSRQDLSQRQQEYQQFDPRIYQTGQQLLRATPQSQAMIKAQEMARQQAKEMGLQELGEASATFETQAQAQEANIADVEGSISQAEAAQAEYQRQLDNYTIAKNYANSGSVPYDASQEIKDLWIQIKEGYQMREQANQQIKEFKAQGLNPIYKSGKLAGFEDTVNKQSIPLPQTVPSIMPISPQNSFIPASASINPFAFTPVQQQSPLKINLVESPIQLPYQTRGTVIEQPFLYNDVVKNRYNEIVKGQTIKSNWGLFSAGVYTPVDNAITISNIWSPVYRNKVISHEVGHQLDFGEKVVRDYSQYKKSSKDLMPDLLDNLGYGKGDLSHEYYARSYANYIKNPTSFKSKYPAIAKEFEDRMGVTYSDIVPRKEFMQPSQPYNLKLTDVGKTLLTGKEKFAEKAGQTFQEVSTFLGIPETKVGVGLSGGFHGTKQTTPDIIFGPSEIGKGVKTFTSYAPYAIPVVGETLLGAHTLRGVETYKGTKIPTKEELITQYKPEELSPNEWKSYLKTPEGKTFDTQLDDYRTSLKAQRMGGLVEAGTSIAFLGLPVAAKGAKFAFAKQTTPFAEPVTVSGFEALVTPTAEEEARGLGISMQYTSPKLAKKQSRFGSLVGKKPEIIELAPARIDVGSQLFRISGEKVKSLGATQRYTPTGTLKKFYETQDIFQEVNPEDIFKGNIQKPYKYIANKLPIKLTPEETKYGISSGAMAKGIPINPKFPSVRLERTTKGQAQIFTRTKPVTETELTKTLSVSRAIPVTPIKETPMSIFDVEVASKSTKSISPRAAGNIDLTMGKVYVAPMKETEESGVEIIMGRGMKKLSQKQEQSLALKAGTIASKIPKVPKPKISKTLSETKTEPFVFYPKMVGGLGKETSLFYAKGKAEEVEYAPSKIPPISRQSNINANFKTLDFQPTSIKTNFKTLDSQSTQVNIKDSEIFGIANKSGTRNLSSFATIQVPRERQDEVLILSPRSMQQPREVQRPSERFKDIQIFRSRQEVRQRQPQVNLLVTPTRQQRPTRPISPRRPTPFRFKLPDDSTKKRMQIGRARQRGLFIPEIRRYGKFISLGAEPTLERAVAKGKSVALGTLGASVRVRTQTGFAPLASGGVFRPSKRSPFTIVQTRGARLASFGERREIKASRRKGGTFKL